MWCCVRSASGTTISARRRLPPTPRQADATSLLPLLQALLDTLNGDSPGPAERQLQLLAAHLPAGRLQPIRARIDDFDFPRCRNAHLALAKQLDLNLERWSDAWPHASWSSMNRSISRVCARHPRSRARTGVRTQRRRSAAGGCLFHRPALILLDVQMPKLDGYATCRRLKADPATEDIPVIFVTSLGADWNEETGFDAGCVDYITKPISPVVVKARIRTHLSLVRERRLEQSYRDAIYMLGEAGHYNDTDTGVHIWRMAAYSRALARSRRLESGTGRTAGAGGTDARHRQDRHSRRHTEKRGALNDEDWSFMRCHPRIGYTKSLSKSQAPVFQLAAGNRLLPPRKNGTAAATRAAWRAKRFPNRHASSPLPTYSTRSACAARTKSRGRCSRCWKICSKAPAHLRAAPGSAVPADTAAHPADPARLGCTRATAENLKAVHCAVARSIHQRPCCENTCTSTKPAVVPVFGCRFTTWPPTSICGKPANAAR